MAPFIYQIIRALVLSILLVFNFGIEIIAQRTINIKAGLNNSWLFDMGPTDSYKYGEPEFEHKPTFYIGFSYYKSDIKVIGIESSLDVTSKFISLNATDGGIGSYTKIDADYKLFYTDISIYPTIRFGNRIQFVGSVRPNIGLMVASSRSGEIIKWYQASEPFELPTVETISVSGNAREEFYFISIDLKINVRLEYTLNEKIGILMQCQYSRGLNDISKCMNCRYNFNNISFGTGLIVRLLNNK